MDLIEIGTALREGREQKGLTIEAVEEKTKIAPSVIVALEEGNSSRFPHAVYARGFVRSYALLLGLDAQELCDHFSREYPVPRDAESESHPSHIHVKMNDSGSGLTTMRIVMILGVLILGALGWYVFDQYQSKESEAPAPVEEQTAPPVPPAETQPSGSLPAPLTQMQEVAATPTEEFSANTTTDSTSGEVLNATSPISAPAAQEAVSGQEQAAAAEPVVTEEPVAQPESVTAAAAPAKERSLRIAAHSASWLQARPDDKIVDYFLRKGETTTITFSESLSIKFGNAGGVKLELDGQPYPFEGTLGEVKTLVVE